IAARSRYSLDIAIADQVYDGFALAFIVFDNQQALYITAKELPDDIETVRKRLVTRTAFNKSECSKGQCALALCLICNDLNRNMASCKVAFEAIEYQPAFFVRINRNRVGFEVMCQRYS